MNIIRHVVSVPTLADLKTFRGDPDSMIMLSGKMTPRDGQGGLYGWVEATGGVDNLTYVDSVMVTGVTTGYWQRVYLSAKTLPQGLLVSTGGVKTLYMSGTTDSSGNITINLTEDNTPTEHLYLEIYSLLYLLPLQMLLVLPLLYNPIENP